jgi:hypothetical protein
MAMRIGPEAQTALEITLRDAGSALLNRAHLVAGRGRPWPASSLMLQLAQISHSFASEGGAFPTPRS